MSKLMPPPSPSDHARGSAAAPVTLVEFGDYECPQCGRAHPIVREALRRMAGSVRFFFRQFPLTEIHRHALLAAEAAESAPGAKFWAMHDTLLENQDALELDALIDYAESIELDLARFIRDLETHAHLPKVKADFRSGVLSGVDGTPTFFINGIRFEGPAEVDTLTAALQAALQTNA